MPRPKRDYGAALRLDISRVEAKITALVHERERLQRMLQEFEAAPRSAVDIPAVVRAVTRTPPRRSR